MRAADVGLVIQDASERSSMATAVVKAEIVSGNGSQFISKDFKQLVRQVALSHIRIRTYHPESNGVLERYHRTTREELSEEDLRNLSHAREIIARWSGTTTTACCTLGWTTWSPWCTTAAIRRSRRASVRRSFALHVRIGGEGTRNGSSWLRDLRVIDRKSVSRSVTRKVQKRLNQYTACKERMNCRATLTVLSESL